MEMTPYLKGTKFSVCHFSSPTKERQDLVIIVDEADEYVSKNAVKFRDDGSLGGLASLQLAQRTFFVSATATDFLLDFANVFRI